MVADYLRLLFAFDSRTTLELRLPEILLRYFFRIAAILALSAGLALNSRVISNYNITVIASFSAIFVLTVSLWWLCKKSYIRFAAASRAEISYDILESFLKEGRLSLRSALISKAVLVDIADSLITYYSRHGLTVQLLVVSRYKGILLGKMHKYDAAINVIEDSISVLQLEDDPDVIFEIGNGYFTKANIMLEGKKPLTDVETTLATAYNIFVKLGSLPEIRRVEAATAAVKEMRRKAGE